MPKDKALYPCCDTSKKQGKLCPIHQNLMSKNKITIIAEKYYPCTHHPAQNCNCEKKRGEFITTIISAIQEEVVPKDFPEMDTIDYKKGFCACEYQINANFERVKGEKC